MASSTENNKRKYAVESNAVALKNGVILMV